MLNEHVTAYLTEYLKQTKATFAVLVSGAWGSGKTYIIKRFFEGLAVSRYLYVSVNGVSTEDELRNRFVYAAYPAIASKKLRAVGSLARSALGIIRFKTDLTAEQLLDYDQFEAYVIDDLERAQLPLGTLLGFINDLVEHDGKRVVLLANEEELSKLCPDFKRIKEKVVGFTLGVAPDVESLLSGLEAQSSGAIREVLRTQKHHIVYLFNLSNSNNLRVLSQVISEYVPVAEFLAASESVGDGFKTDSMKLFLALNMAYKLGKISRDDIRRRKTDHFSLVFSEEKEKDAGDPMRLLDSQLQDFDVYSSALDNEYLEYKICDGLHREDYLARSVGDAAPNHESNPEWRNAWHYMRNDDKLSATAFSKTLAKFIAREYVDAGVIIHVFGLLIEMRTIGLLDWTDSKIEREGKCYIDDLSAAGTLPLLDDEFLTGFRYGAAHGLGFTNGDSPVFTALWNYYRNQSDHLKTLGLIETVRSVALQVQANHSLFVASISPEEGGQEVYSTPVLQHLDARAFARSFVACDAAAQLEIMSALGSRYASTPYPQVLRIERPWLKKLRSAIRGELRGKAKLTRVRVERLLKWNLSEHLEDVDDQTVSG